MLHSALLLLLIDLCALPAQKPVLKGSGVSLYLFPETSAFRKWCFNLVANAWFERLVIAVILVRTRFLCAPVQSSGFHGASVVMWSRA